MKKKLLTILLMLAILILVGVFFAPHMAHAVTQASSASNIPVNTSTSLIGGIAQSVLYKIIGGTVNVILMFVSNLVTIAGVFLSLSINFTLHIKDLYTKIPAIDAAWVTVRNVSSILIIFMLLYASILTILSVEKAGLKRLVGMVFMAGLLINFSLFFVKVAIDASNLVSLQFYNAIAPGTTQTVNASSAYADGGLSNIFMQSLAIPKIYGDSTFLKKTDVTLGIILAGLGGILIMVTAAISFFAAAIAFMIRTGLLLFIMALSPVFFVGMIFPKVKTEVSDKLLDLLKSQLIFMPVYLFLMYISLKFISDPGFMGIFNTSGSAAASNMPTSLGIIIQFTIAMLFINAPLLAAIKLGGSGMKWAPNAKGISKWAAGFTGQHTLGRGAKFASDKLASSEFAKNNPNLAVLANKGLTKVSGATFLGSKGGYDKRFKDYSKVRSDYVNKTLSVSDKDKTAYAQGELGGWDMKTEDLEHDEREIRRRISIGGHTAAELKKLEDKRAELAAEIKARETAKNKGATVEYLENEILSLRKKEAATNMSSSFNPITKKARQDASRAIRKEFKKGKGEKMLKDLIAGIASEDKEPKDDDSAEKPK